MKLINQNQISVKVLSAFIALSFLLLGLPAYAAGDERNNSTTGVPNPNGPTVDPLNPQVADDRYLRPNPRPEMWMGPLEAVDPQVADDRYLRPQPEQIPATGVAVDPSINPQLADDHGLRPGPQVAQNPSETQIADQPEILPIFYPFTATGSTQVDGRQNVKIAVDDQGNAVIYLSGRDFEGVYDNRTDSITIVAFGKTWTFYFDKVSILNQWAPVFYLSSITSERNSYQGRETTSYKLNRNGLLDVMRTALLKPDGEVQISKLVFDYENNTVTKTNNTPVKTVDYYSSTKFSTYNLKYSIESVNGISKKVTMPDGNIFIVVGQPDVFGGRNIADIFFKQGQFVNDHNVHFGAAIKDGKYQGYGLVFSKYGQQTIVDFPTANTVELDGKKYEIKIEEGSVKLIDVESFISELEQLRLTMLVDADREIANADAVLRNLHADLARLRAELEAVDREAAILTETMEDRVRKLMAVITTDYELRKLINDHATLMTNYLDPNKTEGFQHQMDNFRSIFKIQIEFTQSQITNQTSYLNALKTYRQAIVDAKSIDELKRIPHPSPVPAVMPMFFVSPDPRPYAKDLIERAEYLLSKVQGPIWYAQPAKQGGSVLTSYDLVKN